MCSVIVDVNIAQRVLVEPDDPEYGPLHRSFLSPRRPNPILVYGGKLLVELAKNRTLIRKINELGRAGRAQAISDREVNAETATVVAEGKMISDDAHVIALARVSKARVLCSEDKDLRADFKNRQVLGAPGKLYSKSAHRDVLYHNC